jgi:hypothetical protein
MVLRPTLGPLETAEKGDWLHNRLYLSTHQTAIGCGACPLFQQTSLGVETDLAGYGDFE